MPLSHPAAKAPRRRAASAQMALRIRPMTTPLPSGRRAARDSASERKALWEAAHGGRLDDVRRCLDAGVSVDAVYQGSTPLWYAAYYGHAEVDLAMLSLFGRVPEAFYRAYGQNPRAADFQHRVRLYNLYHLLNHHNLFGAPYTRAVQDTAEALLRNRLRS